MTGKSLYQKPEGWYHTSLSSLFLPLADSSSLGKMIHFN